MSEDEVEALVEAALSIGINTFDLADIYGDGQQVLLGKSRRPDLRDQMWIQSKCGIRKDGALCLIFPKIFILDSLMASPERLRRTAGYSSPSPTGCPHGAEEVAEADQLEQVGKVRHLGCPIKIHDGIAQNGYQTTSLRSTRLQVECAPYTELCLVFS